MLLSHFLIRVLHKIHYTAHIHGVLVWLIKYILANKMLMPTFCIMLIQHQSIYAVTLTSNIHTFYIAIRFSPNKFIVSQGSLN